MSPSSTLEELETRAHLTLAAASRARSILRHPHSPRSVERGWRLVATLRGILAFADPEAFEPRSPEMSWFIVQLLQLSHNKVGAFVKQAIGLGLGTQPWLRALADGLEALRDALEGLYLSRDPEFRTIVTEAIKELDSSQPSQGSIPDWRASLANMPD